MQKYITSSLELHLFFARIMKEHSLFLKAGFTPRDVSFSKEAEYYKEQFEQLLLYVVQLSDGIIGEDILRSGEIVTDFTKIAEEETQCLTGITIDQKITSLEHNLRCCCQDTDDSWLLPYISQINRTALGLLDGLIALKQCILKNVLSCQMFTANYPLLIEHIIREAELYRMYVQRLENKEDIDNNCIYQSELFWDQIMMEHAMFIRGLLDPTESELIQTADNFAKEYAELLKLSMQCTDQTLAAYTSQTLSETVKFRDFKQAGTKGISECNIRSIILPLLADHVLREANHYIRLLKHM